jgi:hypothetical protein
MLAPERKYHRGGRLGPPTGSDCHTAVLAGLCSLTALQAAPKPPAMLPLASINANFVRLAFNSI